MSFTLAICLVLLWSWVGYKAFMGYCRSMMEMSTPVEAVFALLCGPVVWLVSLFLLTMDIAGWVRNKLS